MGNRQKNGFVLAEAGIKIIRNFYRTGIHAITASRASLRIDPVRMLLERHLKLSGFTFHGNEFG